MVVIHGLDLSGKLEETPYLGYAYIALMAASVVTALILAVRFDRRAMLAAGGLAGATILGYAVSRTVGMPDANGDIGNWMEPLGVLALAAEAIVVAAAVSALALHGDRSDRSRLPTLVG